MSSSPTRRSSYEDRLRGGKGRYINFARDRYSITRAARPSASPVGMSQYDVAGEAESIPSDWKCAIRGPAGAGAPWLRVLSASVPPTHCLLRLHGSRPEDWAAAVAL